MKKIILILAAAFMLSTAAVAAASEAAGNTAESKSAVENKKDEKAKYPYFLVSPPIPGYTEQTSWSALLLAMVLYMDGPNDGKTYQSIFYPKIVYTLKNQLDLLVELNHYFLNNEWYLKAMAEYKKFPDVFYGIGNSTLESASEDYTIESIIGWLEGYKRITGNFYAGARLRFEKDNMIKREAGLVLDAGGIEGSRGGMSTGFGLLLKIDDRDNTMFITKGDYSMLSADFFGPVLGGNKSFGVFIADLRKYFKVAENQSVGVRLYSENLTGNPPFNFLAMLGGSRNLRGYAAARYRDRVAIFSCAEYKAVLLDWLAVTAFAGLGDVGPHYGLEMSPKYSAGIGARIIVDKKNMTNLRVDFAYGKDGLAFYIDLADNF